MDALRPYCKEKSNYNAMLNEWIVGYRMHTDESHVCICGQTPIKELCYIIHKQTNQQLCVGNQCIEHFGSYGICPKCKIYEIDKNTHHKCDNCRRKETRPTGRVLVGKYKGKEYSFVWETDPAYSKWVLETPEFKDTHFQNYLKRAFYLHFKRPFRHKNMLYNSNNGQDSGRPTPL